jgi:hypothetical protein
MAFALLMMLAIPAFAQDGKAGAGDDQQVPENEQTGDGKEMVTKTFEFTLTGEAPEGTAFFAVFLVSPAGEPVAFVVFCGDPGLESVGVEPEAACEAGVYTKSVEVAAGTSIDFDFIRTGPTIEDELFHGGTETLDADMTNTAFYTFGKDMGAGDDQQDVDKDTGTGDEQEVPDNQQDEDKDTGTGDDEQVPDSQQDGEYKGTDTGAGDVQQDDTQDDQQGEMPEELPDTGMGGLVGGGTIPVGTAAAGLTMLVGAGCAVLRRR